MALQRAVAAKKYMKNSKWAHKPLQGSKKYHKMCALWSSDCPGILVLHFPYYLEDVAIPQVPVEQGLHRHIHEMHTIRLASRSCKV
jgi:hypothetical protein